MSEELVIAPQDDQVGKACSSPNRNASSNSSHQQNWLNSWKESSYLVESTKRNSDTPIEVVTTDDSSSTSEYISTTDHQEEIPLDFSMKKRKSLSGTASPSPSQLVVDASSATYGLMKAFLEARSTSPITDTFPTGSPNASPFNVSTNRGTPAVRSNLFYATSQGTSPLSMAAAAAAVVNAQQNQNSGASSASSTSTNRRHFYAPMHQKSEDEFDSNHGSNGDSTAVPVGSTPDCAIPLVSVNAVSTPPAFYPGSIHSPQNGHQQFNASNRNTQKIQRPFKAYNPLDPMSALQVGAALGPSAIPFLNALAPPTTASAPSSPHLLLSNALMNSPTNNNGPGLPPILNAQLLSQYRQYLINAQAAAAVAALRAKSSQHLQQQLQHSTTSVSLNSQRQNSRPQLQPPHHDPIANASSTVCQGNTSSQSPPQVTSTSHPHTAESSASSSTGSPPSPNTLMNANTTVPSSVSAVLLANSRIRKASLPQLKSTAISTDRRISSGSGSGGSSFNGADEDEDDLQDEDGISNRTSPTPSCASSTAPRRTSIQGNGDGMSMDSTDHKDGANGATSKHENGSSNGVQSRRKGRSLPDALKDEAYWERRRKNNEAAKRSRDARRAKEDEIAIRAALLEQENMRLRIEVAALKAETDKLRQMLLNT